MASFTPRASFMKKPMAVHPIEAWLKASMGDKFNTFHNGSIAMILIIKKPGKIIPISLLSQSSEEPSSFKLQAGDDLSISTPGLIEQSTITKCVLGIINKTAAIEFDFDFDYIDVDVREGIKHSTDPTNRPNLVFTHLPAKFPPDKAQAILDDHQDKDNIPVMALIPKAVPMCYGKPGRYGKPAPSGVLSTDPDVTAKLQANHNSLKTWADSINNLIQHHPGNSLHVTWGLNPTQLSKYHPGSAADKLTWKHRLSEQLFRVVQAMTNTDDDKYADQYNLVKANALYQCEWYKTKNQTAKQAYAISASSRGINNLASAINAAATLGSNNLTTTDPLLKQQHRTSLRLLCLQMDDKGNYLLQAALNPLVQSVAKSGMKATTSSDLNRNLHHFTNVVHQNNDLHSAPYTIEQKYNRQAWTLSAFTTWIPHAINNFETLIDDNYWSIFNLTKLNEGDPEYLREKLQIQKEKQEAIANWDSKDRTKGSTKATRSFNVNSEQACACTLTNFIVLIQYLAADERYQPHITIKHLLIKWNEDILFTFTKKPDRSWKHQMDQGYPWFWF